MEHQNLGFEEKEMSSFRSIETILSKESIAYYRELAELKTNSEKIEANMVRYLNIHFRLALNLIRDMKKLSSSEEKQLCADMAKLNLDLALQMFNEIMESENSSSYIKKHIFSIKEGINNALKDLRI